MPMSKNITKYKMQINWLLNKAFANHMIKARESIKLKYDNEI